MHVRFSFVAQKLAVLPIWCRFTINFAMMQWVGFTLSRWRVRQDAGESTIMWDNPTQIRMVRQSVLIKCLAVMVVMEQCINWEVRGCLCVTEPLASWGRLFFSCHTCFNNNSTSTSMHTTFLPEQVRSFRRCRPKTSNWELMTLMNSSATCYSHFIIFSKLRLTYVCTSQSMHSASLVY